MKAKTRVSLTVDEAMTIGLISGEGTFGCRTETRNGKTYVYPVIRIKMCDREALEPAARALGVSISHIDSKAVVCPPHLFPPDGRGEWTVTKVGAGAVAFMEKARPFLSKEVWRKWESKLRECKLKRLKLSPP